MKEDRKIKNVVLIMLDTLQFNYLGCYGNKVVKTPNIDRLARQGFLFENAYSEGLPTVPVRRALMTGRFTLPYGGWQPLAPDDTTVADIMWGKNMQTALVYDTPPMRLPKYGYSRGFDFVSFNPGQELDHTSFADVPLDPALKPEDYTSPTMVFNEKGEVIDDDSTQLLDEIGCFLRQQQFRKPEDSYISRVMTDAQNWLSNRRDKTRPFLLWVDSFDPHEPWDPESVWKGEPCPYDPEYVGNPLVLAPWTPIEGRITERECEHIRALYMEKITQVDKWVGELLDSIRAQGLWDETLIVLMSDHGQPMGEGELLSVREMLPALHAMGKGLEVAHHIGSARAFHGQIHRPEAPVVGKMHGEMHGARSCVHGECADAHGRRVGSALRQRLARRPARRNGGTAIAYLLERLGLREVGDRQRHAVLAHAFEARGGGAIAIIVDDARLEIGEHDIDVEVIRNARSRGHPTGNHRRIIASPHPRRSAIDAAWAAMPTPRDTARGSAYSASLIPPRPTAPPSRSK